MTKRPDQHNIDPNEAGATDHKTRARTEEGLHRTGTPAPPDRTEQDAPDRVLEARRAQSESARQKEQERARHAREKQQGASPDGTDREGKRTTNRD